MWARNGSTLTTCPTSFVSAQSIAWLESYFVWRTLRHELTDEMDARQAEAFLILEREMERKEQNGK
ncbi:MAG: hypothetical protein WD696_16510 [Bryobacteraceae bacterium]